VRVASSRSNSAWQPSLGFGVNQIVQQLQTHRMDVGSPPGKQLARRMPAGVLLPYNAITGGTKDSQKSLFVRIRY
jgi:hypothetical protein